MTTNLKDADAVLDYTFDWSDWLVSGDTIATKTITAQTGLTVNSSSIVAGTNKAGASVPSGAVQVWVQGGTTGNTYTLLCHITTTGGRTDDRTMYLQVVDR
jgi:hypothetical protein